MEEQPSAEHSAGPATGPAPFLRRISPESFAILSLAIVFFLYQIVGGAITFILFTGGVTAENVVVARWATLLGQLAFILVPTIVLVRLRHPGVRGFFRVRIPDHRHILLTIVGVFALQQLLTGYMTLQEMIPLPEEIRKFVEQFKNLIEETYKLLVVARSPGEFIFVALLVIALTPAVCEELLFRGLVQRSFEEAVPGMRSAIVAGVIFGAYHLNPFTLVPLVAIGVYLGFIVHRSRNITVAMSAHFFNNVVACAAVYMQLDDDFVVIAPQGKATAVQLFLNYAFFGVVFVAATYYFIRITSQTREADVR